MADAPGLTVRLRQGGPIPLDVDLDCGPGEMLALVGPSGSGKTTVLRTVAGLYRPVSGAVRCGGAVWLDTDAGIDVPPHRRRAGLVFQSYALFPHMTALGNVTAAMGHRPRGERDAKAQALLRMVHLDGLEHRMPSALSGGQQQRVAVARALARDPGVLLLDEPFSAVDRRTRRRMQDELASLRSEIRIPIVMVTHDLSEAETLADRICVLDAGETLGTGTPAEILRGSVDARMREALDLREVT
ncbi:ABC transporter [Methylobacterium sp. Leaf113]|uniref:ABC transporter ATP-binding protein n=1 Tax=Methylobacterium sp. Leaf113 TaxID=1736259 RepID=UPI0006F20E94|nr:ABC transporter ATP-binding protein [Methylobacterium sp. Leaf113]KQP85457.1 ABC transporter [Methylobacterium sp. Leaf113]